MLIIALLLIGCTGLRGLKRSQKIKFGHSLNCDSFAELKYDGAYFLKVEDSIVIYDFYAFQKDGTVIQGDGPDQMVGIYKIENDTISMQFNYKGGWLIYDIWCRESYTMTISGDTLRLTPYYCGRYGRSRSTFNVANTDARTKNSFVFMKLPKPIKIDPKEDIRRYGWMWEDKKEYKAWKKAQQPK